MKKTKKFPIGLKVGAASLLAGSIIWVAFANGKFIPVPSYTVSRVIDGDTFVTAENQHVRLAGVEAPELDRCGGEEAKQALEKLIMGKPIYFKMIFSDTYNRMVSLVYTKDTYVNKKLLQSGYAYYMPRASTEQIADLKPAGDYARSHKAGIFSDTCTQTVHTTKPSCNIKGNVRNGNIYYLPDCGVYHNTVVQLYMGDRWFCTEQEAIKAGFRKPEQCK